VGSSLCIDGQDPFPVGIFDFSFFPKVGATSQRLLSLVGDLLPSPLFEVGSYSPGQFVLSFFYHRIFSSPQPAPQVFFLGIVFLNLSTEFCGPLD